MSQLFLFMRLPKQIDQIFKLANEFHNDTSYPVGMTVDECGNGCDELPVIVPLITECPIASCIYSFGIPPAWLKLVAKLCLHQVPEGATSYPLPDSTIWNQGTQTVLFFSLYNLLARLLPG
jgi:hypothetical protein